jgi:hypothetical protein
LQFFHLSPPFKHRSRHGLYRSHHAWQHHRPTPQAKAGDGGREQDVEEKAFHESGNAAVGTVMLRATPFVIRNSSM